MLKHWRPGEDTLDKKETKARLKARRAALAGLQQELKAAGLPVIVQVEGWGAAGKGTLLKSLIRELDPRLYRVVSTKFPTEEERRWPFLKRHMERIPPAGKILFLDSGWVDELVWDALRGELTGEELDRRLESARVMERQLAAGGYLLVKLFLHIDEATQRDRLDALEDDRDTAWRVSGDDRGQNRSYPRALEVLDRCLAATQTDWAPWKVLDGTAGDGMLLAAADWLYERLAGALKCRPAPEPVREEWPLLPMPPLSACPLDGRLDRESYQKKLKECRKRLAKMHNRLYRRRVPLVVVYEGWDAAGKGGNIKRLTSALDPRGCEVQPIASPSPEEAARHYLWRFWTRLPKTGHVAVFDRSWYGRVMVERIEGFCSEADWKRAYDEINQFERELTDAGAVVVKFWVNIDRDTQLARFRDRENDPAKRWKITDEDWRNREKWDQYETAVDEMLARTSTENAPWHVLPSVDKRYARICAMETVLEAVEKAL